MTERKRPDSSPSELTRIVVVALISAVVTGMGTYLAFVKDAASRTEVRQMIQDEASARQREINGYQDQLVSNWNQLQGIEAKIDALNMRIAQMQSDLNAHLRKRT